jgi:hypothetical protein
VTKTLPVFGVKKAEHGTPTVFGPADTSTTAASVWVPVENLDCGCVFSPPTDSTALAASVFFPAIVTDSQTNIHVTSNVVTAAHEVPKRQGQREIDRVIRKFLKQIKAQDIRIRRVGHTTYSWKHPIDPEPSDTGSDVRWEIKLAGQQIHMGVYDIKPFYRVVSGPFDVEKLVEVRKNILDEMDTDAGE